MALLGLFMFAMSAVLLAIMFFVFWIIMLIDAATRKFKESNDKVIWILVIIFVNILGALIYYFVVYMKDSRKSIKWFWWTLLGLFILFIISLVVLAVTWNTLRGTLYFPA